MQCAPALRGDGARPEGRRGGQPLPTGHATGCVQRCGQNGERVTLQTTNLLICWLPSDAEVMQL